VNLMPNNLNWTMNLAVPPVAVPGDPDAVI
jgi:hypothetical protein